MISCDYPVLPVVPRANHVVSISLHSNSCRFRDFRPHFAISYVIHITFSGSVQHSININAEKTWVQEKK